jgi:hypothetical protein
MTDIDTNDKEYDNLMKLKNEERSNLSSFFEDYEEPELDPNNFKKHWVGMPDYTHDNNKKIDIIIHFKNSSDIEIFSKLIGQKITNKTKYLNFPEEEKNNLTVLKWIEEDD